MVQVLVRLAPVWLVAMRCLCLCNAFVSFMPYLGVYGFIPNFTVLFNILLLSITFWLRILKQGFGFKLKLALVSIYRVLIKFVDLWGIWSRLMEIKAGNTESPDGKLRLLKFDSISSMLSLLCQWKWFFFPQIYGKQNSLTREGKNIQRN